MNIFKPTAIHATLACFLLGLAGQAKATTWVATFTGTVKSGADVTGVFTASPAYLDGQAFTARFVYDPSIGTRAITPGIYDHAYGGVTYSAASPILSASLTIAGRTVAFPRGSSEEVFESPNTVQVVSIGDYSGPGSLSGLIQLAVLSDGHFPSIERALSQDAVGDPTSSSGNMSISNQAGTYVAYGVLDSTHVTIAQGVPEPASWTMMLVGIGGLGAMVRRQRAALAA